MTLSTTRFPRTKAEVSSAPWCNNIDDDRSFGGDLIFIEVRYDWLPEKFPVSNFCSARGETFQEALAKVADGMRGWNPIKEGFYIDQMCTYADERRRRQLTHS